MTTEELAARLDERLKNIEKHFEEVKVFEGALVKHLDRHKVAWRIIAGVGTAIGVIYKLV